MRIESRKEREMPAMNTSALPDIIFMLLFFFMVVTVLREHEVNVKYQLPEATQLKKLVHPSIHHHIYTGTHKLKEGEDKTFIQLNDKFVSLDEIGPAVKRLIAEQPEKYQDKANTCLQADVNQSMELLSKIKLELRKVNQLNLAYVGKEE